MNCRICTEPWYCDCLCRTCELARDRHYDDVHGIRMLSDVEVMRIIRGVIRREANLIQIVRHDIGGEDEAVIA